MQTIGSCSKCGGPVQLPMFWGGSIPPKPTCGDCGAVAKQAHGPVIPMERRRDDLRNKCVTGSGWLVLDN